MEKEHSWLIKHHLSHLFGVYPGDQITPKETPDLFKAARVSLERRLLNGANGRLTRAWVPCLFARMGEEDKAWEHLIKSIVNFSTDPIFHTDIMHAVPAAICEMLLQDCHEELCFLPALPSAWPNGKITGLRAKGGYTVNLEWKNGRLFLAEIIPLKSRICTIKQKNEEIYEVRDSFGLLIEYRSDEGKIKFNVKSGQSYFIRLPRDW